MDTSMSLLLEKDNDSAEYCFSNVDDREDSSSGYDSSESCDDVTTETKPHDIRKVSPIKQVRPRQRHDKDRPVKFKSTRMLCEDLKLILDMPEMCDVTFLVGQPEVPVHGVRAILGTRSRVFYQLILQHLQIMKHNDSKKGQVPTTKLYIPVKKYDTEVFRSLVQYVHCGIVTITVDNVTGLLCGASQFKLSELEDACWQYIRQCLVSGRGYSLLEPTRRYKHFRLTDTILNEIYRVLDELSSKPLESTV